MHSDVFARQIKGEKKCNITNELFRKTALPINISWAKCYMVYWSSDSTAFWRQQYSEITCLNCQKQNKLQVIFISNIHHMHLDNFILQKCHVFNMTETCIKFKYKIPKLAFSCAFLLFPRKNLQYLFLKIHSKLIVVSLIYLCRKLQLWF